MPRIYRITPPSERFWGKVQKSEGCWLWTGARLKSGYGKLTMGRRVQVFAHRVSYEMHNGPIPEGLYVCHRCDTPRCVRPDHLFVGSNSDNIRDAVAKGRHGSMTHPEAILRGDANPARRSPENMPRGERHGRARISESQAIQILTRYRAGDGTHASLAREYGVSKPTITALLTGRNWQHLSRHSVDDPEVT